MKQNIVSVAGLSHSYGKGWAVSNLSFELDMNGVMGLLGSNGAGKSTTMNILCGIFAPTKGRVIINGINMAESPVEAKKHIGFLPQTAPLYTDLTVDEYLTYTAHLRLVDKKQIRFAVEKAKEKCGVVKMSKRLIKNLSGGYRQRVGIAQAIIHEPKLVVLDEPTNGLDPNQIYEVRSLIKEIAEERAVIFSSHILSEVQATCKDIRMIEQGHLVFSGTMDAFNNRIEPNSLLLTLKNMPTEEELMAIAGITRIELVGGNTVRLHFDTPADISERIAEQSVRSGWGLRELTLEKTSLEAIFAQLSGKK